MFFKSVNKIEIGACGVDGTMGTSLTDYKSHLVSGSFNVNLPKPEVIKEWADGKDTPSVAVPGRTQGITISFRLEQVSVALLSAFLGGTLQGTSPQKYIHPTSRNISYKSVKITGDIVAGKEFVWALKYCLVSVGLVGSPSADAAGKMEIDVSIDVLIPLNGSGVPQNPWEAWDGETES